MGTVMAIISGMANGELAYVMELVERQRYCPIGSVNPAD